ncbi:hypothetical protein [Peribacillus sp. SCS-37]|uniref:hypothetical protein n=1 Tax=Paraperibacillus esterisolvens TaxID=3115296 RepID=UPI0039069CF7
MFGPNDFWKFFSAFFLIFPMVTLIHLSGHIFFVALFGGKDKKIVVGCGKVLFSFWKLEFRTFYFWSGGCEFTSLRWNNQITNSLIFLGGALFNLLSIMVTNFLITSNYMEANVWTYQFQYFSFNTMFFALFPMDFPNGTPSDGRALWLLWKHHQSKYQTDDLIFKAEEEIEELEETADKLDDKAEDLKRKNHLKQ